MNCFRTFFLIFNNRIFIYSHEIKYTKQNPIVPGKIPNIFQDL